jgi:hypothetical protein
MFLEVVNDDSSDYFDCYDINLVNETTTSWLFSVALWDEICPEIQEAGFLWYISFSVKQSLRLVYPSLIYPFWVFKNENDESFSGEDSWKNIFLRRRIASTIESLLLLRYPNCIVSLDGLAGVPSNNRFLQLTAYNWHENISTYDAWLSVLQYPMRWATVHKWPDWILEDTKNQIFFSQKS